MSIKLLNTEHEWLEWYNQKLSRQKIRSSKVLKVIKSKIKSKLRLLFINYIATSVMSGYHAGKFPT